ncbi:excisionase family DNA-binding protein [Bacillus sp. 1P06AnD]|uniref:excisionase family DNA-binding protein n=1 Tax=Bacillus sp. 1P06AnD TaxID=3132208 RepID=UPI0039A02C97
MYLTVKEAAEYLSVSPTYVEQLILNNKIRTLYDGEQHLIYKNQFKTHFEQLEKYQYLIDEIQSEPIPEDMDIKDED